jgi:hypothetical protein
MQAKSRRYGPAGENAYGLGTVPWARSNLRPFLGPSCVVGILPLILVGSADALFGPWRDSTDAVYYLQAILGPPLLALFFVPRFGRRAIWVAAGGVLVAVLFALTLLIAFVLLLSNASES